MPHGSSDDAGQARSRTTRRHRALSTLAISALLVGTVGAGAVQAQSPSTPAAPGAVTGDASFFGWDAPT